MHLNRYDASLLPGGQSSRLVSMISRPIEIKKTKFKNKYTENLRQTLELEKIKSIRSK